MKNTILISPFSKYNAKDYPFWTSLISELIKLDYNIIQVSKEWETKLNSVEVFYYQDINDLKPLLNDCKFWISVDNFFHHFAHYYNKKGIVLWGLSDPNIFGYKENINLFLDKGNFRKNQFDIWDNEKEDLSIWIEPFLILENIKENFLKG